MTNPLFAIEQIPDDDRVYVRIEGQNAINNNTLDFTPMMIRQHGDDGISCDWSRYSDADKCLKRGNEKIDSVISFNAGEVRGLRFLSNTNPRNLLVDHSPEPENQSHSLILRLTGSRTNKGVIRNALVGIMHIDIPGEIIRFPDQE